LTTCLFYNEEKDEFEITGVEAQKKSSMEKNLKEKEKMDIESATLLLFVSKLFI